MILVIFSDSHDLILIIWTAFYKTDFTWHKKS